MLEHQLAKKLRPMEVWLLGLDRAPAEVMGRGCCVCAFIEIAQELFGEVVLLQADQLEGNDDQQTPAVKACFLFERYLWQGGIPADRG